MQEREAHLSEELAQAQANLDMLRRLHQASQNQLFRRVRRRCGALSGLLAGLSACNCLPARKG